MIRAKATRLSRAAIDRALRDVAELWRPPPDPKANAAGAGTEAALNKTKTSHSQYIPAAGKPQRGPA